MNILHRNCGRYKLIFVKGESCTYLTQNSDHSYTNIFKQGKPVKVELEKQSKTEFNLKQAISQILHLIYILFACFHTYSHTHSQSHINICNFSFRICILNNWAELFLFQSFALNFQS